MKIKWLITHNIITDIQYVCGMDIPVEQDNLKFYKIAPFSSLF